MKNTIISTITDKSVIASVLGTGTGLGLMHTIEGYLGIIVTTLTGILVLIKIFKELKLIKNVKRAFCKNILDFIWQLLKTRQKKDNKN